MKLWAFSHGNSFFSSIIFVFHLSGKMAKCGDSFILYLFIVKQPNHQDTRQHRNNMGIKPRI